MELEGTMKLNEKGKYFTERVSKRQVQVVVNTLHGQVLGQMFVLPAQRIKDLLNNVNEQFIAITEAVFIAGDGQRQEVGFVAINKQHIVSVIPINEEVVNPQEEEDGFYPY
jgi:hypothetical protein